VKLAGRKIKLPLAGMFKREAWVAEGATKRRQYQSYDDYLEHQKSKLATIGNLERKRLTRVEPLRERLAAIPEIRRGMSILCLGARQGGECEVLIELGAFAVGIDVNPGAENRYVMTGDFHQLQFADASIDGAFTNCLEHAYDIGRVVGEIKRLLKPGGVFIAEIVFGSKDELGRDPGDHDCLWWDYVETPIEHIKQGGFKEIRRASFMKPFRGVEVVLESLP